MNESLDCPKIPREPIDKSTNLTWKIDNCYDNADIERVSSQSKEVFS